MIVYSVTVAIEDSIEQDWVTWMKDVHIPEVMATGKFIDFRFCRVFPHHEDDNKSYNISYRCKDMDTYLAYQENESKALQEDHTKRYEGKFAAFRTILEQIAE
jgi:hypothetical protein